MRFSYLLISICALVLFSSCGVFKKKSSKRPNMEQFDTFYDKFHSDPQFQMSRLKFPLEGVKIDGLKEEQWSPSNWHILKVKIQDVDTKDFNVNFSGDENSFTQSFKMKGAEFYAEYKFQKIDGKWFLVYAKDVNL